MKIPNELLWGLTRRHTSFHVKRAGETFTKDPTSITNRVNASDAGLASNQSVSLTSSKTESKSKKGSKQIIHLHQRHHGRHATRKTNTGASFSTQNLTHGVKRAAKVISTLKVSEQRKKKLLSRLQRLHQGNPSTAQKAHRISKAPKN